MTQSQGWAAQNATTPLAPYSFTRRDPQAHDVVVDIDYCGVCHSDIHSTRNEWKNAIYPMVPGHEIIGHVTAIGSAVTKFKVGDLVGVGVIVDSCRTCSSCKAGEEQYCEVGMTTGGITLTYGAYDKYGELTQGGYSTNIVADEHFVHRVSPKLNPAGVAPLLCAGITTYSPLRHWNVGPNMKVGVVGLGGLGHMALKFAHSFGAHVVQFTTSESKIADAKRLGADEVVISKDTDAMKKQENTFDFILDTVSAPHPIDPLITALKRDATYTQVGLPDTPPVIFTGNLLFKRRNMSGSIIGGMAETQEMLDYCAEKGITSDIEMIGIGQINEAFERVVKADVKYRFVIDMKAGK
ncbi:NAD(P)-dependent alcohol dehydrogenase [Paracidobacterium acidisoli]|uniref:NAD(P)-dependent alcohol dehydrogenase n=1 Tax=Paracidobacterium acidisoli TaxID=2303751 RepID=A0A372IMS0_9BACT|nr:NAD(P)-dependent alcohol dehydrogenase [Paracidobacterium acidisoli]MBT9331904.1 NAD(P)-dependent alcohol dehydrogenase [Paracidobacterium acidisoli]